MAKAFWQKSSGGGLSVGCPKCHQTTFKFRFIEGVASVSCANCKAKAPMIPFMERVGAGPSPEEIAAVEQAEKEKADMLHAEEPEEGEEDGDEGEEEPEE